MPVNRPWHRYLPRRRWLLAIALVVALVLGAGLVFRPDRAIRTATATVAHDLCSVTFVTGVADGVIHVDTPDGLFDLLD